VNFKLAVLKALAKHPERRATPGEIRREVGIIIASGDQNEQLKPFSALGGIDIFQSGLVVRDETGLQITDAGLSLLRSLESSSETPDVPLDAGAIDLAERIDFGIPDRTSDGNDNEPSDGDDETVSIGPPDVAVQNAPAFLRRSFGSKIQDTEQSSPRSDRLRVLFPQKKQMVSDLWRRYFSRNISNEKPKHSVGSVGGAAFAFLILIMIVTCAGAVIALGQIKSLKSDIAKLHQELLPLKERLGKLEQIEKTKRESDQQKETQTKSVTEKNKPGEELHTDQTALSLSRDEVQLIRDYIKPVLSAGMAAPAINVGDPVNGATIPLPSPLTERVPKLTGARFTIRNGAIIIVKRDSHQADAVLAPN
jgi:hypothetical protein